MNKINNNYNKVYNEITQFFKEKEEDIIDKLQFEVTKIKEKFEYYITDCNTYIKFSEKINKIMKLFNNENDNNIFKKMIYLSKINDRINKTDKLKTELMKNVTSNVIRDKLSITFAEYYFNGIPIANHIELKNINSNSFKLFWNIDNINLININIKYLKSIVEFKEHTKEKKFIQVYEGNGKNCLINNLNKNTCYEIRIRF